MEAREGTDLKLGDLATVPRALTLALCFQSCDPGWCNTITPTQTRSQEAYKLQKSIIHNPSKYYGLQTPLKTYPKKAQAKATQSHVLRRTLKKIEQTIFSNNKRISKGPIHTKQRN